MIPRLGRRRALTDSFGRGWPLGGGALNSLAPVNTSLPVIAGTPRIGQTITGSVGTWTGAAELLAELMRGTTVLASAYGAGGVAHVLGAASDGQAVMLRVTARTSDLYIAKRIDASLRLTATFPIPF